MSSSVSFQDIILNSLIDCSFVAANKIDIPEMDCQTEDLSDVGEKSKMILLVKDEDGKLREVKLCGLSRAVATNDTDTVRDLLEKVSDDPEFLAKALRCKDACFGYTAFHWAAKYGSSGALKVLLHYSKKLGNIHLNLKDGSSSTYNLNLASSSKPAVSSLFKRDSPLHVACQSGHLECVKLLVENGMNPGACNNRNRSALHLACEELHLPVIRYLIMDCKLTFEDINHPSKSHCNTCDTPLFRVIRTNTDSQYTKMECLQFLLANGADPLARGCFGATTVQRATMTRNSEILTLVLNHLRDHCTPSQLLDLINHRNISKGMIQKPLDLALEDSRGKDLATVQLLLSRGAKPSLKNFDLVCRENEDINFLKAFMENAEVLTALLQELNSKGFCCRDDIQSIPPFISIINSSVLSPREILEWLDYVLQKVKPDECFIRDQETRKYISPLAMLIKCMGDIIVSFDGESSCNKLEAPEFPFTLVQKLVTGGSDVNGFIIAVFNAEPAWKKLRSGRFRETQREEKTVHPLTYAQDNIYDWGIDDCYWKKTLLYLAKAGSVLNTEVDKPPYLTLTARALALLTEQGVLKPETIPFNQIYEEMKCKVRSAQANQMDEFEDDPQEMMNLFEEFLVYTGALIDELGPGIIANDNNTMMMRDMKSLMPGKFQNAPTLKILSRHSIRNSIANASKESLKRNMNTMIDHIPSGDLPRPLKEQYLKMNETHKTVDQVEAEYGSTMPELV